MNAQHKTLSAMLAMALLGIGSRAHADTCALINAHVQKGAALVGSGMTIGGAALKAAGVSAVMHSSGGMIVSTAGGGYVAGTLGTIGTAVGFLTAPAALVVGTVVLSGVAATATYCHVQQRRELR